MSERTNNEVIEARWSLIRRSVEDEAFRERLLADPRSALERELGKSLPGEIEVRVVEESPGIIYLVLPPWYADPREGDELSERELESVAGGLEDPVPPGYTIYCGSSTKSKTGCDRLP